jgi:hypothetical protein
MAVCPTLRTAAVGVTRAGRRDGGRQLAQGNRMSVAKLRGGPAPPLRCRKEDIGSVPGSCLNSGIRFAFSGIRSMARLLSRLPTQVSHDNMPDQPAE